MQFLMEYGLFLAKITTIVVSILVIIAFAFAMALKDKEDRPRLRIKKINDKYDRYTNRINEMILDRKDYKKFKKQQKKDIEERKRNPIKKVFVIDFYGDIKASETHGLTECITAILTSATTDDEVVVRVDSGGGMVHAYGLASSQLQRIRQHNIPLTVAIDKVAASGGYMMACVADRIIAAPFAIVGSIGVIAQLPNFNRFLKKRDIEYEQIMAGEYKRTLSMFGENTKKDRVKTQEDVENIHTLFKNFVTEHRPQVLIDQVSTGEHWHGIQALQLNLVDQLITSDEYLLTASKHSDIYQVKYKSKRKVTEKFIGGLDAMLNSFYNWTNRQQY